MPSPAPRSPLFSPDAILAAPGPLLQIHLGADGLPARASAAARLVAPPARVWAVISDVDGYAGRVPKYFLGHHPEIQHGILPGVALALLDSMRRAAEAR